jgi:protein CMS1
MSQDNVPKSEALASKAKSKRRSREDDGGRRKKRKTGYEQDDSLMDTEMGVNTGIGFMDPQLMADHLGQRTTRFASDLSSVELADLYISRKFTISSLHIGTLSTNMPLLANAIHDTTSWQEPRILAKLPDFLEKFTKEPESLSKAPKKKGSPHTIIVAGAGLRAADVVRALRKYQSKDNSVAKLVRSSLTASI